LTVVPLAPIPMQPDATGIDTADPSVQINSIDEALATLVQMRLQIEQHETSIWLLARQTDELRQQIRQFNAETLRVANRAAPAPRTIPGIRG
jgi:hypothetical protein